MSYFLRTLEFQIICVIAAQSILNFVSPCVLGFDLEKGGHCVSNHIFLLSWGMALWFFVRVLLDLSREISDFQCRLGAKEYTMIAILFNDNEKCQ
jgi:hypothetical protein